MDTNDFISYKVKVKKPKKKKFLLTISDFKLRKNVFNVDTLNSLYNSYVKSQEYQLKSDLSFNNSKILNKKYINENAKKYWTDINYLLDSITKINDDLKFNTFEIYLNQKVIIDRCKLLTSPLFEWYKIDVNKDYKYPYLVSLPQIKSSLNDTLFYNKLDVSEEEQLVDVYCNSDSTEINKIIKLKGKSDNIKQYENGEIYNSTKYLIEKANGRIKRINVIWSETYNTTHFKTKMEYIISYK